MTHLDDEDEKDEKDEGEETSSSGHHGEHTIRHAAEELLEQSDPVLTYSEVLDEVRRQFPDCNTTRSSLRWYATRMRKEGKPLPSRPLDVPTRREAGSGGGTD